MTSERNFLVVIWIYLLCNLRWLLTNFIMKHTVDLNYSAKNPNSSSVIRNFHKCKKLHLLLV